MMHSNWTSNLLAINSAFPMPYDRTEATVTQIASKTRSALQWALLPISLAMIVCSTGQAQAQSETVDQAQLVGQSGQAIHATRDVGQSFVVGAQGWLAGIEVLLQGASANQALTLELLDLTEDDYADAPVIGVVSLAPAELGDFPEALEPEALTASYFDLSGQAIAVEEEDLLAFRLTTGTPVGNTYSTRFSTTDLYASGEAYIGTSSTGSDFAFKTFVEPEQSVTLEAERLDAYMLEQTLASAVHISRPVGQSFTAGRDGTWSGLELNLSGSANEDLVIDLLDMSAGDYETAPSLGTIHIDPGDLGASTTGLNASSIEGTYIDLSALEIQVLEGDELAFSLTTAAEPGASYSVGARYDLDRYEGGTGYVGSSASAGDHVFKTFIVPEPSTELLHATVLIALGSVRRLRHRAGSGSASTPR